VGLLDLMSMAKPNLGARDKVVAKLPSENMTNCFQCIKCTSGCTALKLLELKPHEIVKLVNLGFVDELSSSDIIWRCVTCLKCIERCPQKASPYHLIMALRNLAAERETKVPDAYMQAVSNIMDNGIIDVPKKIVTRQMEAFDRDCLKLPKLKHPKESFQTALMKAMEER
jgi:heterodisulfide reductase subunit C